MQLAFYFILNALAIMQGFQEKLSENNNKSAILNSISANL